MYPLTWEVPLNDVYLDSVKLPKSTLSSPFISLSTLINNVSPLPSPPTPLTPPLSLAYRVTQFSTVPPTSYATSNPN